jgi:hypothetical protein
MNQRIIELFDYVDGKLLWKFNRGRVKVGDEAGAIIPNGRLYVQVDGKKYLVHRVIWFLHYGECPPFLDHIDGNPLNNHIDNLRPATKSQNAMNRKVRKDSATGVKGITTKGKRFGASIYLDGIANYLGTFDSASIAHAAYAAASTQHFKEFARV